MEIWEYIKDAWGDLWNPQDRTWQIIDRILFVLLPVITLLLGIMPLKQESWRAIITNLLWLIPLSIWLLFILLIVPYRLASKYHRQRDEARKKVTKLEGNLGQVGDIEAFMFDGIENRNKLKYYKSRGSTLDDFELNKFRDWYRDVSEYLQKNIYSEYPYWYQTVDTGLIKLTLDDAVKAYESGLGILGNIQKRLVS